MQLALEWTTTNYPFTICTDSHSLLKAIERRSPVTHHLRSLLNARPGPTTFLWVSGRKGIPINELADTKPTQPRQPPKGNGLRRAYQSFDNEQKLMAKHAPYYAVFLTKSGSMLKHYVPIYLLQNIHGLKAAFGLASDCYQINTMG